MGPFFFDSVEGRNLQSSFQERVLTWLSEVIKIDLWNPKIHSSSKRKQEFFGRFAVAFNPKYIGRTSKSLASKLAMLGSSRKSQQVEFIILHSLNPVNPPTWCQWWWDEVICRMIQLLKCRNLNLSILMEFEAASMALAWVALLMDYGQFSRHRSLKDWIKLRVETFFVAMWNHDDDDGVTARWIASQRLRWEFQWSSRGDFSSPKNSRFFKCHLDDLIWW